MNKAEKHNPSMEEVLFEFSMEDRKIGPELLDEYAKQYPEYGEALTELAVDLAIEELCPEESAKTDVATQKNPLEVPAIARAMSRFQYQFNAVRLKASLAKPQTPAKPVENPFSSLTKEQIATATEKLEINIPFFIKLRDRLIEVTTIPEAFIELASKSLNVRAELMYAHLSEQPQLATAHYKATEKPAAVAQQSYKDAVLNSGLTTDQQKALLALNS